MPNAIFRGPGGSPVNRASNTGPRGPVIRDATVEVAANAAANTQYEFFTIPTNARIHNTSRLWHDDLASTGSPTLDIGFASVDSNFTTDVDALNDGIDVFTAAGNNIPVIKDHANAGRRVWELLGLSSDPGGLATVIVTILDAATNTGGTVTMTLHYSVD